MLPETATYLTRPRARPLLRFLSSFPIACFCGALLTDLAYLQTANPMWADFSAWLLAVGVVMGALGALVGVVTLLVSRDARAHRPLGPLVFGSVIVLALAAFDNLVHSRDAWSAVVPLGLILSAATVIMTIATLWLGTRDGGAELTVAGVRR